MVKFTAAQLAQIAIVDRRAMLRELFEIAEAEDGIVIPDMQALSDEDVNVLILTMQETYMGEDAIPNASAVQADMIAFVHAAPIAMNGITPSDPTILSLNYTSVGSAVQIPSALVYPGRVAYKEGTDLGLYGIAEPIRQLMVMVSEDAASPGTYVKDATHQWFNETGVAPQDIGKMTLNADGTPRVVRMWARYGKLSVPENDNTWPMGLMSITVAMVAALNLANCNRSIPQAVMNAGMLALGLINLGGDGFNREWVVTTAIPPRPDVVACMHVIIGPQKESYANACRNHAAKLGFNRLSNTHIYSGTDAAATGRFLELSNKVADSVDPFFRVPALTNQDQAKILWSSVHAYSMTGAVGFFLWWCSNEACSPYLAVRSVVTGDLGKSVGIVNAGLTQVGMIPLLLRIMESKQVKGAQQIIAAYMNEVGQNVCRTSSLSRMLCGLNPVPVSPAALVALKNVGAMIKAGSDAEYISSSIGGSHFLENVKRDMPGLVTVWANVFSRITQTMTDVNVDELIGAITTEKK